MIFGQSRIQLFVRFSFPYLFLSCNKNPSKCISYFRIRKDQTFHHIFEFIFFIIFIYYYPMLSTCILHIPQRGNVIYFFFMSLDVLLFINYNKWWDICNNNQSRFLYAVKKVPGFFKVNISSFSLWGIQ